MKRWLFFRLDWSRLLLYISWEGLITKSERRLVLSCACELICFISSFLPSILRFILSFTCFVNSLGCLPVITNFDIYFRKNTGTPTCYHFLKKKHWIRLFLPSPWIQKSLSDFIQTDRYFLAMRRMGDSRKSELLIFPTDKESGEIRNRSSFHSVSWYE